MAPDAQEQERSREKWASLVGRFILLFGDIENVTYLALLQLPKDKIFLTTSSLGFAKRVDLVLELLDCHPEIGEDLTKSFSEKLNRAKKLSITRNIVAHSPLMMAVYEHSKEGWKHHEIALGNARNKEQRISFEALTEAADQAQALAAELYELYSAIHERRANDADD